jgi:hypothetical protein
MRHSSSYYLLFLLSLDASTGNLPSLFESSSEALGRHSTTLEKLTPDAWSRLQTEAKEKTSFAAARRLFYGIVRLEEAHPDIRVTLRELRREGDIDMNWTRRQERSAIQCLKMLSLIVTRRNSTVVATREKAYTEHIRSSEAWAERRRARLAAAAEEEANRKKALTWHEIIERPHQNPSKLLLITPRDFPGSTIIGEMLNRNDGATLFSDSCRAFERKLGVGSGNPLAGGDRSGEAGSGHEPAVAATCLGLVLRLLRKLHQQPLTGVSTVLSIVPSRNFLAFSSRSQTI